MYSKCMREDGKKRGRTIYGVNPVREALRAGSLGLIYIHSGRRKLALELSEEAKAAGVEIKLMHDMGYFDRNFPKGHQGVAAEISEEKSTDVTLDELMEIPYERRESAFFIVLDQIEDPRNVGAILRSAEAAGMHGAVMQERRSAPLGAEAMKSSAGALAHIPVCMLSNIKTAMRRMSDEGIRLIGAEAGAGPAPWDANLSGPVALVIGSEGQGLRRTVADMCHELVSLPIRGKVGSLNASAAAAVLIYEALRQGR